MAIHAYVFFSNGTCDEAFAFYRDVFGGDLTIVRSADMPQEARMPGADPDMIMHAALRFDGGVLMGSDDPTGDGGPKQGFALAYTARDTFHAERAFEGLSSGGEITAPLGPTAWSEAFGMLTDRYGVPWLVDVED